jgi:hypothetical protein
VSRGQLVVAVGLVVLLSGGVGYTLGESTNDVRHEHGVMCHSAEKQISCELEDDWTVSVPLDVHWTDADASHSGARPRCLPPGGRGLEGPVSLTWVPVETDGQGWRQVVSVGC